MGESAKRSLSGNEKFLIFTLDDNKSNQVLKNLDHHFGENPCQQIVLIGFNRCSYACKNPPQKVDIILVKSQILKENGDTEIAGFLKKIIGNPDKLYVCLHKGDSSMIKNNQKSWLEKNYENKCEFIQQHHNSGSVYDLLLNISGCYRNDRGSYNKYLENLHHIWLLESTLRTLHDKLNEAGGVEKIKKLKDELIKTKSSG